MEQISRGKFNRLQRATAEFTTSALDGCGLRDHLPARPAPYASYPVLVHRLASLLHAAFRPRLATTPLRFAITSPPSGCEGDLHPQAVKHARHTNKQPDLTDPAVSKRIVSDTQDKPECVETQSHCHGRSMRSDLTHLTLQRTHAPTYPRSEEHTSE